MKIQNLKMREKKVDIAKFVMVVKEILALIIDPKNKELYSTLLTKPTNIKKYYISLRKWWSSG